MTEVTEFQVKKSDLSESRIVNQPVRELDDGEVLAKVDRFAFTANNITYGVVGERIGYWNFFPVEDQEWGIIPVWGFADIIETKNPDIPIGERLYGYWPMATHLVMKPARIKEQRLLDGAEHRASLPPVYNSYARVNAEPHYKAALDDARMALFPLYATSFCLYDFCKDNDWFGAEQIIIPSASSKTAVGTAYAFKEDETSPRLIGLTSSRNKDTVEALGLYDQVVTYDDIESLNNKAPTIIIDMSGNGDVLNALHKHLGDNMRYTSNVGVTHYEANKIGPDFIKERSAMFFAPGHIQKRAADWGPGEFEKRAYGFWARAAEKSNAWLNYNSQTGREAVEQSYQDVRSGKTPADTVWIVGF